MLHHREMYIVKYHHGGTLLRLRDAKYVNGSVLEFLVDIDKLCYWDLLGEMKELGYDITKSIGFFLRGDGGILMQINDDEGILGLVDQLQKHHIVDVYVEISDVNHDKSIPDTLLSANETDVGVDVRKPDIEIDVELDVGEADEDNNGNNSGEDDEERLVDVPTNYNSDDDEEREEARSK